MNVLSLTHAHLNSTGLSPVSCERVDSLADTWSKDLHWQIDVVHTANTLWRGIWPNGAQLKINIIKQEAPTYLMMDGDQLFSAEIRTLLTKKRPVKALSLVAKRISKRVRKSLSDEGLALPLGFVRAKKWGELLLNNDKIAKTKYNLIFVSVGYGDEYLLQTGLTISEKLKIPMIVDLRDLWSEHHDPDRFNDKQKRIIHALEKQLLKNTILISVPQKHMVYLVSKWSSCPVYLLSHSAYVGKDWEDGKVTSDEFTLLYAGKLYASAPGLKMLMELLQKLSERQLYRPLKCRFFVDDPATLEKAAIEYGVRDLVSISGWISPSELWKNTRSAHLLLVPDPGVAENYPLISTKTFQLAYSGRQILCLSKYPNIEMEEFLNKYDAGIVATDIDKAAEWASKLSFEKSQYEGLPSLRDIKQREQAAADLGNEIEKIYVP